MTPNELQQAFGAVLSILRAQQAQKDAEQQHPETDAPNQVPVSVANVESQPVATGNKGQQPQRTGSKGQNAQAQVPSAAGGAQPSFQLGATSPHGQPKYMNAAKDMNLHIPPKKKAKANQAKQQPQQASTATPEIKQEPKPPARPVFYCTEPDCEVAAVGFATEEAKQAHVQTEHIQPSEDPRKFFQENLAATLGLDLEGNALNANAGLQNTPQTGAATMSATQSKQGHTPASFAPTPMSRGPSMNRSASGAGPRQQAKSVAQEAPRVDASKAGANKQVSKPPVTDAFAASTIDPQALFADVPGFNSVAGGVFSDPSVLQALTPNDTPDSKDSGATEATAELPELGAGDLDSNWQAFDDGFVMLPELDAQVLTEEEMGEWDKTVLLDAMQPGLPDLNWDEVNIDFAKPFTLDTSLYSMDPTASA